MRKKKEIFFLDQIMAYFAVIIFPRTFKILYLENSDKGMRSHMHKGSTVIALYVGVMH